MSDMERTLTEALNKLNIGMDEGPYGDSIEFTPAECCMLWRTIERHAKHLLLPINPNKVRSR